MSHFVEIKVYWGISKKLNPKNGRIKVLTLLQTEYIP